MRTMFFAALLAVTATASAAPVARSAVYAVRPDLRMCPSPACGGWWITKVNQPTMRCVDGSTAQWCYVAEIDWTALGLSPADEGRLVQEAASERVLVRGGLYLAPFGAMTFGGLAADRTWVEFP